MVPKFTSKMGVLPLRRKRLASLKFWIDVFPISLAILKNRLSIKMMKLSKISLATATFIVAPVLLADYTEDLDSIPVGDEYNTGIPLIDAWASSHITSIGVVWIDYDPNGPVGYGAHSIPDYDYGEVDFEQWPGFTYTFEWDYGIGVGALDYDHGAFAATCTARYDGAGGHKIPQISSYWQDWEKENLEETTVWNWYW